uniref:LAGLIDADG homing endonuclease n=1 Tax=Rhizoctonia solani TaxID=456999 RepID=A0A8E8L7S0_9AGAM|nr:LAGLIDADG homing endonuclease [Rhizoctonia solani]
MKKNYLTQKERLQILLPPQLEEILVGLILGDLCLEKRSESTLSVRAKFQQGLVHKDYLMHLYELFKTLGSQVPITINRAPDKRTGEIHSAVCFNTYSLPCFYELYSLFYLNGKKIVPSNIGDLLTPLGLAYWLADDGSFHKTQQFIRIYTNSFSYEEVQLLASALSDKFNLKSTVNKDQGYFIVRISQNSVPDLQALLKDIMPSMMMHKLGL